jgi:hypothetical protein
VVISTDGGRIRIRKNKRGPRTQKGRRRYSTHWREPKLLIIYTVDDNGKMDRSFAPFIEGTLKGPDAVFGLIHFHLAQLSVHLAEKIVFVADDAHWIWNRVAALFQSLGIAPENELPDFKRAESTHRQRCRRKCGPQSCQSSSQRSFHLLAGGYRRGNASSAILLQSRPVEYIEKISIFF